MITRTRRRLLRASRALRESATLPPGVEDGGVYHGARSGYFVSDDQRDWNDVYKHRLDTAMHPAPTPARAAE
jgi:phthalate 4,5-dioxygenase oxygenase subunit